MELRLLARWPSDATERARLAARWNALVERAEGASVFQRFEWHDAWWRTFGHDYSLRVLLIDDDDGTLVAIAPLMLARRRRLGRSVRSLMLIGTPNHASDYADFIVARGHVRARRRLCEELAAMREDWDRIELQNLPAASATPAALADAGLPRPLKEFAAVAPARVLDDPDADRRAANKKSLRRHVNGFARSGRLQWKRLDASEAQAHLELFFAQHRARWAGTDTPSLFADRAEQRFYRALAQSFDDATRHFSVVLFDDRPIAYHFGFEWRGVLTWYKPSFDPALAERSPGEVLIKSLLDDALARGLAEFDFTVGDEAFKFRFANRIRHVDRVRVYRHAWERWPALARLLVKRVLGRGQPPPATTPALPTEPATG